VSWSRSSRRVAEERVAKWMCNGDGGAAARRVVVWRAGWRREAGGVPGVARMVRR
jgi:hypothetical protein